MTKEITPEALLQLLAEGGPKIEQQSGEGAAIKATGDTSLSVTLCPGDLEAFLEKAMAAIAAAEKTQGRPANGSGG